MERDLHPSNGLTRRELLRRAGALGGGVLFAGPLSGCGAFWERQPAVAVDAWHKGVCRFCGTGCGLYVGTRDGRVVDVKGDEYNHNAGLLCVKGILNKEILYADNRAHYPMVRQGGRLVRATWDEAMSLVAERFQDSIARRGPDAVAFFGSGQLFTEESYTANKLFKAGIGTNNVEGNPRLCMASAVTGYISTYGKDEPLGCYEDMDHADCFFITGANMAECHPVLWRRVMRRKQQHPDAFLIVVDPRGTRTADAADLHLDILPGTDIALYNAMIYQLIQDGFVDEEMVDRHLTFRQGAGEARTFDDLVRHVAAYTPERVAPTCGVAARRIREAAYRFGASGATMSMWTMGINQQSQGTAANRLLNAMHLLTGHVGRPGATPFSLTGQPNACGGVRDTGALSHALPNGRLIANAEHRREMEELWGLEAGRINATPGLHTVALFQAMEAGDVECCLVMCTNPAHSLPNVGRYRAAMEKAFLVVADACHPTETTELADVVLPAAMWTEKGGVFGQTERRYQRIPKVVDPPGEARADLDILVDLADRLGHGDVITARTPAEVWDEWRRISAHSTYDFSGITYERMAEAHGIQWPCPEPDHPGTQRRYVPGDDPFARGAGRLDFYGRPDGRAVVWLEDQEAPKDPRTDDYPLVLTTGRYLEHWHTMTMTGHVASAPQVPVQALQIHPEDARTRGIEEGMPVRIGSRRGDVTYVAHVTDAARPGVVFATWHSPDHLINRVTKDVFDPISKEPEYKISAVQVEPADPQGTDVAP